MALGRCDANIFARRHRYVRAMVDVVVIGAGVNGLCVAWALRERGFAVEVWTRDEPAATTSAIAGAIWYPFLAEPRERVLGWSAVTFRRLQHFATIAGSGVRMTPVVETFATPTPDLWWAAAAGPIEVLPANEVPAPNRVAIRTVVPMCDVPVHLPWLVDQLSRRAVPIVPRTVRTFDEAFARAPVVVNCSGLGSVSLCDDRSMRPVRGQIVVVEPRPGLLAAAIDGTAPQPFYVLPRGNDVVLGGTAQIGDADLQVRDADTCSILDGIAIRWPPLRGAVVRATKVGLRPWRPTVRVEREVLPGGRRLVHDYGHGGAGWTLSWGCAEEVAALVSG
jgi:D-amino-acid oxidase